MKQAIETVLVTGASSGIGLELAKCFAAAGSDLVLVARNRDALEKLAAEIEAKTGSKLLFCRLISPCWKRPRGFFGSWPT
jgi:short-subunit dehydrogenase